MPITLIPAYDHPEVIRELFTEYTTMLVEGEPAFQGYLNIQNYDKEIRDLSCKYGLPQGRLYLAYCGSEPVGCIALRMLDHKNCEMKRLYVRPQFRKQGIGRMLCDKIIADARSIGYKHMLLDTLPFLDTAVRMYREIGFYDIPQYNDSPLDTTIFLKLNL